MDDKFIIEETTINGLKILVPERFSDDRGHLSVLYNKNVISKVLGLEFVQDKWTKSAKGVLRGIHFQTKHPQGKLVSVLIGKVLDVIVDLRRNSATFGKYFSIELNESEAKMLYIPEGLGHAFLTLEDNTIFFYKTTDYFYPEFDSGILWNDKDLNIDWQLDKYGIINPILSKRDMILPKLKDLY